MMKLQFGGLAAFIVAFSSGGLLAMSQCDDCRDGVRADGRPCVYPEGSYSTTKFRVTHTGERADVVELPATDYSRSFETSVEVRDHSDLGERRVVSSRGDLYANTDRNLRSTPDPYTFTYETTAPAPRVVVRDWDSAGSAVAVDGRGEFQRGAINVHYVEADKAMNVEEGTLVTASRDNSIMPGTWNRNDFDRERVFGSTSPVVEERSIDRRSLDSDTRGRAVYSRPSRRMDMNVETTTPTTYQPGDTVRWHRKPVAETPAPAVETPSTATKPHNDAENLGTNEQTTDVPEPR